MYHTVSPHHRHKSNFQICGFSNNRFIGQIGLLLPDTNVLQANRTDPDAMQVDAEDESSARAPPLPQGLSTNDVKVIVGKKGPSVSELGARKLGILRFLSAANISADKVVLHYLAAACDPQENPSK